jgi:hypothetical protein
VTQTELETFRQEIEHIEQGGFAAAVRPEKYRQRSYVPELNTSQRSIILYAKLNDPGRFPGSGVWGLFHLRNDTLIARAAKQIPCNSALRVSIRQPSPFLSISTPLPST